MKCILTHIFFLLLFSTKLFACAGTNLETFLKNEYYNFTDPDMVDLPRDNPLYKLSGSYNAHNARFKYFAEKKKEANIQAWQKYFKGTLTKNDIEALFYKKNAIAKSVRYYKNNPKYPDFSKYINFLNLQNQLAQNKSKANNYQKIIQQGVALFKKETKPFLKERYLYLIMRLYHHNRQYHKLLDIYANNALIINQKGIVKEWINALRAGSYQHLQQTTKANQLYAKIFETHQTNAHYGYYDFKINNDEEWKSLLESTQNKETKALYHFLRAMQWGNEPIHELKAIANIAPNSIWFERLTYMIMQELQNRRYDNMIHVDKKSKRYHPRKKSYKLQKKYFLAVLKTVEKKSFFTLYSQLYLTVLNYHSLKQKDLEKLRHLANNKQRPYAKLLTYIYGVHQLSSSSPEDQYTLYQQLKLLLPHFSQKKQTSILRYTILQITTVDNLNPLENKIHKLFAQNKTDRKSIFKTLNNANASKFKAYIEKRKRSFFGKKVFKQIMSELEKGDVAKILATLYLQENNFTEAQFYLRQIPKKNLFTPYNPFNATINTSNKTISKQTYSQRKFVETMLRIESALKKKPESAINHFLYANALYNKSWFGNFPLSSVLYRSSYLEKGKKLPITADLSQAKKEYELAFKYANKEEFRAKISYQLLKIKFNKALSNSNNYNKDTWSMPYFSNHNNGTKKVIHLLKKSRDFSEAIKDFKADYQHTKYGKEVIKKCITFKYF